MTSLLRERSAFLSSISFHDAHSFCAARSNPSSVLLLTLRSNPATLGRVSERPIPPAVRFPRSAHGPVDVFARAPRDIREHGTIAR